MSSAPCPAGKAASVTDAQLAAIPARMCQQCGLSPASAVKTTLKGLKRYVCLTCKAKARLTGRQMAASPNPSA